MSKTGYDGEVTSYVYDSANRLIGMRSDDYLGASYHYDPAGRLLDRIFTNGQRTTFSYDADGRVTAMKEYASGGALIRSEKYCYDAVGNIEKKLLAPGATCGSPGSDFESYTYDNEYRLATAFPGYSFGYDSVGNMTVAVCPELEALRYEYDADNRLQRVMGYIDGETVYQFTYDENGNRIEKRDGSGALLESYVYDAKNRLVELDAGGQVTHYEYDPYDYRISQETNGEKTLLYSWRQGV